MDWCRRTVVAVLLFGGIAFAQGEPIGQVANFDPAVRVEPDARWLSDAERGHRPVRVNETYATADPGDLSLYFYSERVAAPSSVVLHAGSTVHFIPGPRAVSLVLQRGSVKVAGPSTVHSGKAVTQAAGTEYIVRYDPSTDVTEVIGISGTVTVLNSADRAQTVSVGPQERARVVRSQPPSRPERLDEATFATYVKPFEFVGQGSPESQALNDPLLSGSEVPEEDRLRSRERRASPDDWLGRNRAGLPGTIFESPPSAIESPDLSVSY